MRTTPLPLSTKASHGLGAMSNGVQLQIGSLLLLYYNQVLGVPAWLVSLALAISLVLDAFWDPAIGMVSDQHNSRWGRRHPFMVIGLVPTVILFLLLYNPPAALSQQGLFVWLLLTAMGLRFFHSLFEVPSIALTPELATGYHERTGLVAWRWVLGTLGAAVAAILAYGVFLKPTEAYPVGQLNPAGYAPLSIAVACMIAFAIVANILGTKKHIPELHRPPEEKTAITTTLKRAFQTLSNYNFIIAVIAGALAGIGFGVQGGLTIYLSTYFWELPAIYILVLTLVGMVSVPFAAIAARILSVRYGKKYACMATFFICVLVLNIPILLRLSELFVPNGSPLLVPLLALFTFVGSIFSYAGFVLVSSMLADIVEDAQSRTGARSEGLILSADSVVQKIITAIGTILPGIILTVIDFPEKAFPGYVDETIIRNLGVAYFACATVLSLLSIATWNFYRISEDSHNNRLGELGIASDPMEMKPK